MTHTPAPWYINYLMAGYEGGYAVQTVSNPCTPNDIIASHIKTQSNARLIASAPALLEALEALEAQAMLTLEQHPRTKTLLLDAQIKAIEVIKQAKGE